MTLYDRLAYDTSRHYTEGYSNSFGLSSRLFSQKVRPHIYAIYGLVRLADEIVDTIEIEDKAILLTELETDTYRAIKSGYSTNPLVHAFALTARTYSITGELIDPFFTSMRLDLMPHMYTRDLYQRYIHGSAEVIGLMCLRVFCATTPKLYDRLAPGASALGAAYQKVNFLRDIKADHDDLGRFYFPDATYESFDDAAKRAVISDIKADLAVARPALRHLPRDTRQAVMTSLMYYKELIEKLENTPVASLKTKRLSVAAARKLWLLVLTSLKEGARL